MQAECVLQDIWLRRPVRNTKPHLGKLEDRSTPMVLLGKVESTKTYRLYDPRGGKVVVSRDVMFDEKVA